MEVTFKVFRFDPNKSQEKPEYKSYKVNTSPGMTVLDALNEIKWNQDGTLTFRKSCRSGICGSCAMKIHGINRLACETQIEPLKKKTIVIDPLPGFEVIKDLAVDIDPFFEHLAKVKPYLINDEPPPDRERIQSPDDFKHISDPIACILCMSCTSSCPSFWGDPEYIGPAALYKAYRYVFDTRDKGLKDRIDVLDNKHGLWRCHTIFNCMDACPKQLKITHGISLLKRKILSEKL
ncbi:succinate dehydrogenase iron-sulfur subunit [bacterium]|nr:succinate dehydrogenase iron-sulfur subunit [bacterium]